MDEKESASPYAEAKKNSRSLKIPSRTCASLLQSSSKIMGYWEDVKNLE
jgi:hypothetical protein